MTKYSRQREKTLADAVLERFQDMEREIRGHLVTIESEEFREFLENAQLQNKLLEVFIDDTRSSRKVLCKYKIHPALSQDARGPLRA
jgi:hypothetical protein